MKKTEWLFSIIFSSIGLLFLLVGIFVCVSTFSKKDRYVESTAVITRIEPYRSSDGKTSHRVYVGYKVDGESYNGVLGFYSSNMRTGKKVTIYYDPDSPYEIIAGGGAEYFMLIIPGMGALFFIIGAAMMGAKIAGKSRKNKLAISGELLEAKFDEVSLNTTYSVNGRHPYKIICSWTDTTTQTPYIFKSENIWDDPLPIIEEKGITVIPVYIERYNPKKYYVSLDILK